MDEVVAKIARWKELYFELNNLRCRLRDGPADAGANTSQLRFEMRRLQCESEKALDELLAAVAAVRPPDSAAVREPSSGSAPAHHFLVHRGYRPGLE